MISSQAQDPKSVSPVQDIGLIEFLGTEFPVSKEPEKGFLDIAGVQYRENTITKIYSYFLDKKQNPVIADLFLNSLLELIAKKTNAEELIEISNHVCMLEVLTEKIGRIDLLIISQHQETKSAIIIENKIFSGLYNNLQDYWESTRAAIKQGVLLTLTPYSIEKTASHNFINITHAEWMQTIKRNGLPAGLSIKEYVYLNDFITHMENLSNNSNMNDDTRFFFNHAPKVLRATQTLDSANNYVLSQLKIASEKLGLKLDGNGGSWRNFWDTKTKPHVYYTIVFDLVTSGKPEITLYLEIYKDALLRDTEFRQLLTTSDYYSKLNDDGTTTPHWSHLAYKTYPLSFTDIEHLSDFISEKIESDFKAAYELILSKLAV